MPATYEPITTQTLTGATSSITLNSIPQTYTDLRLVFTFFNTAGLVTAGLRFNGNSAANYIYSNFQGFRSGVGSSTYTGETDMGTQSGYLEANSVGILTADILSYTNANARKSALITKSFDNASGSGFVARDIGCFNSLTNITSITIITGTGNFSAGSTVTLFGILKA